MRWLCAVAGLLVLWVLGVQGNLEVAYREDFDNSMPGAHTAAISVSAALAGLLLLSAVVPVGMGKAVHMAHFVATFVWCAMTVVGLMVWVVTYDAMRYALEEQTEMLLSGRTSEVSLEVGRVMDAGPQINEVYTQLHKQGVVSMNHSYPTPMNVTVALTDAFINNTGIAIVYWGNRWEYTWMATRVAKHTVTRETMNAVMVGAPRHLWVEGGEMPSYFRCRGTDTREDCAKEECGKDAMADLECGKTCLVHNRSNCLGPPDAVARVAALRLADRTSMANWLELEPSEPIVASTYLPTSRPWYKEAGDYHSWTKPYVFSGGQVGISCVRAVTDPSDPGQVMGVLSVDFTIGSLHPVMQRLPPTEGSLVVVATVEGELLAGNVAHEQLTPQVGWRKNGMPKYELATVQTSAPEVARPFRVLEERFGSLRGAVQVGGLMLLHDSRKMIAARPLTITGGLETLVVVVVPYDDVLKKGEDASTKALILALVISAACSLVVAGLGVVLAVPLQRLMAAMSHVARMDLDVDRSALRSVVKEVRLMAVSFRLMVENLRLYREYLPDSLRALGEGEDEEEDEEEDGEEEQEQEKEKGQRGSTEGQNSSGSTSMSGQKASIQQIFSSELHKREVTVLVVNRCYMHKELEKGKENFAEAYTAYLELVTQQARQWRAVVDGFSGDRVVLSLNAVVMVSGQSAKACNLALGLTEGAKAVVGVGSGSAQCGNSGMTGMKRFTVWGKVVNAAVVLCEVCRNEAFGVPTLIDWGVARGCEGAFVIHYLRMVQLPHNVHPQIVSTVIRAADTANEEWMYVIEDDSAVSNKCIAMFLKGDQAKAKAILAEMGEGEAKKKLATRISTPDDVYEMGLFKKGKTFVRPWFGSSR